jgi:sigma-B regulation protein RsbU (phosphoserine phosphatase)
MNQQKILIVDDEPFNLDYLEQELDDPVFRLFTAVNGQDALKKVKSESPDLILLDIMMPVMDGYEVLSRLKADAATRDIPVIVISANNDLQSVVKGIKLGAEDYLPKPFEPTLLHARISSSLEKKRLRDLQQLYLKSLERELDIAREIQQGFLPAELPKVNGWEIGVYFKAAREVAGDFYDAFLLPDGNLVCVIGDVCGKGVGAALFMTLFRSLIRVTSTTDYFSTKGDRKSLSPNERLKHAITFTNNYIAETHGDANMFATIFIGLFSIEEGMLSYINCGNEPPLLIRNGGGIVPLRPTGPVVGVILHADFSVKEISMNKDDQLLAFTDGIPDTQNASGEFYGDERIRNLIKNNLAPAELLSQFENSLNQFIGSAEQFDDITLFAIKREE